MVFEALNTKILAGNAVSKLRSWVKVGCKTGAATWLTQQGAVAEAC